MQLPDGTGIRATNKAARAPFVSVFTMGDGRIVSHRGYWDMAGFMSQIELG